MKLTKKTVYIGLFAILYLIVAFSSFWHACAFFGLANNTWMSIILAFAFEVGQAAVLFSLLTSKKDRSRVMPWVLMTVFTLVQVIGNIFSSYKYLISNSSENLRFFKEPIFIWTDLPDDQTTVIITYIVGAILPICALLLTSMITNYLTDNEEEQHLLESPKIDGSSEGEDRSDKQEIEDLNTLVNYKNEEIEKLKQQLNNESKQDVKTEENEEETKGITNNENDEEIISGGNRTTTEKNKQESHFVNL